MFIDEAEIYVKGGDGGDGGSVYLQADVNLNTLQDFVGHHHWRARRGQPGRGKNMTGRSGEDLIVRVPPGTLIFDKETNLQLKDLVEPGQKVCVASGGRGGHGNKSFATATDQAPRVAQQGRPGQERHLRLELKLIADVGLVGMPNAGKSTLLSRISSARPKIADYPFTTRRPYLGIVELTRHRRLVVADIPGLIEGAHEGTGLGDEFLRHIERTTVLIHMLDILPPTGEPSRHYHLIRNELEKYSPALAAKRELIVANKMDLTGTDQALEQLRANLNARPVMGISAITGEGLDGLLEQAFLMVQDHKKDTCS